MTIQDEQDIGAEPDVNHEETPAGEGENVASCDGVFCAVLPLCHWPPL